MQYEETPMDPKKDGNKLQFFFWYHSTCDVSSSPGAVVADSDAVQGSNSENTQGQGNNDDIKYSEFWVAGKHRAKKTVRFLADCTDELNDIGVLPTNERCVHLPVLQF